eukprot:UN04865
MYLWWPVAMTFAALKFIKKPVSAVLKRQHSTKKGEKYVVAAKPVLWVNVQVTAVKLEEEIWQNAEVDALSRLSSAGVRVPQTYGCIDGVLLMELVSDDEGRCCTTTWRS